MHSFDKKIDYYPGAHGNFLDLMLVLWTQPDNLDLGQPLFDENGACHIKHSAKYHRNYPRLFGCDHYSLLNHHAAWQLRPTDRVVEIHVADSHRMTLIVNAHLRAGKRSIDVDCPEIDTLNKYQDKMGMKHVTTWLIDEFGHMENYPRSALRIAYFKMYDSDFNHFQHKGKTKIFPHASFFDFDQLCQHLNLTCAFFELPSTPHEHAHRIWSQFMQLNQGWERHLRCQRVLDDIQNGQITNLEQLGVAEEAWICYNIFRDRSDPWDLVRRWPDSVLARG